MRNAISKSKPKSSDVSKGSNVDMNHSDDNKTTNAIKGNSEKRFPES